MSTSNPVVEFPPTPRKFMPPAAPVDTPYPKIPLLVMNSPGICSVRIGSNEGSSRFSIVYRFTTETVMGS